MFANVIEKAKENKKKLIAAGITTAVVACGVACVVARKKVPKDTFDALVETVTDMGGEVGDIVELEVKKISIPEGVITVGEVLDGVANDLGDNMMAVCVNGVSLDAVGELGAQLRNVPELADYKTAHIEAYLVK